MKKIYLLFCILTISSFSFAQTFPNAGMETWRNSTAGSSTHTAVHAPTQWYGFDSLVIGIGETFPYTLFFNGPLYAQLFQETTIVHSGSSSAKMITLRQDTLGLFPGILTNAVPSVNAAQILATGSFANAVSYSGGAGVYLRIQTVSAWVEYIPGVDSTGARGQDTGLLVAEAISYINGRDSIIGVGTIAIPPTDSQFVQIIDSIAYTDTVDNVDTIRVTFSSSGGASKNLDSSTLYVDDVAMAGIPENVGVPNISANGNIVKVYPNPANTMLNIDCLQNTGLSCQLYSVSGQVVIAQQLTGTTNALNTAALPEGLYFYTIIDHNGTIVQRGKVAIAR